jgi:hypothetical protein
VPLPDGAVGERTHPVSPITSGLPTRSHPMRPPDPVHPSAPRCTGCPLGREPGGKSAEQRLGAVRHAIRRGRPPT